MNVKNLIELLRTFDESAQVCTYASVGGKLFQIYYDAEDFEQRKDSHTGHLVVLVQQKVTDAARLDMSAVLAGSKRSKVKPAGKVKPVLSEDAVAFNKYGSSF